ncbi:7618_t:CDS:1, partial [Racocetra persica]
VVLTSPLIARQLDQCSKNVAFTCTPTVNFNKLLFSSRCANIIETCTIPSAGDYQVTCTLGPNVSGDCLAKLVDFSLTCQGIDKTICGTCEACELTKDNKSIICTGCNDST